jgi:hypothetical protein
MATLVVNDPAGSGKGSRIFEKFEKGRYILPRQYALFTWVGTEHSFHHAPRDGIPHAERGEYEFHQGE